MLGVLSVIFAGLSFILSLTGSNISLVLAKRYKVWDDPTLNPARKKQKQPVPLMGATGFLLTSSFLMGILWVINKYDIFSLRDLLQENLLPFKLAWILFAFLILMVVGYFDDKYDISAKYGVASMFIALLIVVFLGKLRIEALSYPFDQILPVFPLLPELLGFIWLGFCMIATKFLDGHDGLVSSVGIIGLLSVASVSLFSNVNQPLIYLFALIWACGIAGFLPFNFPHARVYLGNSGSQIIGLIVGILAILSGAKVATASTVIGWFIIDIFIVWLLRIKQGRNPLTSADRSHWHHRLVDLGLNKIQVLTLTTIILLITAHSGLLLGTQNKIYVISGQIIFIILIFAVTIFVTKNVKKPT
jgi:UDP-GlcNAc:undecaprenyl-phosphate GlcNAc-1-phosphate transferase